MLVVAKWGLMTVLVRERLKIGLDGNSGELTTVADPKLEDEVYLP